MIGKLTGVIDSLSENSVVIDVMGVGYIVTCSASSLKMLNVIGERASLYIETIVREDSISLYGFKDAEEQMWFRLLMTVQGVGARVALAILSALSPESLAVALSRQDKTALTRADGVGAKLAARLVTELKEKAENIGAAYINSPSQHQPLSTQKSATLAAHSDKMLANVVSALVNLGYKQAEALEAANNARRTLSPDATLAELLRASLARAGSGGE